MAKAINEHAGAYGSLGGSNASTAIQEMIDDVGFFRLPEGNFTCQDPIIIPSSGNDLNGLGAVSSGQGRERSKLTASGMSGDSLIKVDQTGPVRFCLRDMSLVGDADTALDLRVGAGQELYESHFSNLRLVSSGHSAVRTSSMFSTHFERVGASSTSAHSFQIVGGPGVTLMNCYAYDCGASSAGYALTGGVTLIGCNGVDKTGSTHFCYQLGGTGTYYNVKMIGCNVEDFGAAGIYLTGDGGWLSMDGCAFVAPSSGSFEAYIKADTVSSHSLYLGLGVGVASKGATRSGASNIVTSSGLVDIVSFAGQVDGSGAVFPDYRHTGVGITYPVPFIRSAGGVFGKVDLKISRLYSELESGFVSPQVYTITANASTYDATSKNCVQTANTVATNLDGLTGAVDGQRIAILVKDANTTIRHNIGGAGRFIMTGAANVAAANGDVFEFRSSGNVWKQI